MLLKKSGSKNKCICVHTHTLTHIHSHTFVQEKVCKLTNSQQWLPEEGKMIVSFTMYSPYFGIFELFIKKYRLLLKSEKNSFYLEKNSHETTGYKRM